MRRAIGVALLSAWAGVIGAADGDAFKPAPAPYVQLHHVRLVELVRLVWGEILREDYVLDPAFLRDESELSVDVRGLEREEARELVTDSVRAAGFVVEKMGRVTRFGRARPEAAPDMELFVYRPRYRGVAYLSGLLSALFPPGSFSFQQMGQGAAGGAFAIPGLLPSAVVPLSPSGSRQDVPQAQLQALPPASAGARSAMAGGPYTAGVGRAGPQVGGSSSASIDPRLDTFIFRGSAKDIARLQSLLSQVDVPSGELVVRAVVYEVRRSASDASAISIAADLLSGSSGVGVSYGGPALSVMPTVSKPVSGRETVTVTPGRGARD